MRHRLLDARFDGRHASVPGLRAGDCLILALDQAQTGDQDHPDDERQSDGDHQNAAAAVSSENRPEDHISFLLRMTILAARTCSVLALMPKMDREQVQVIPTTLQLVNAVAVMRS